MITLNKFAPSPELQDAMKLESSHPFRLLKECGPAEGYHSGSGLGDIFSFLSWEILFSLIIWRTSVGSCMPALYASIYYSLVCSSDGMMEKGFFSIWNKYFPTYHTYLMGIWIDPSFSPVFHPIPCFLVMKERSQITHIKDDTN